MKPRKTAPEATTSPADSSPSATTGVEPANQPTTIFATASNALTRMLISAIRFPICMLDVASTLPQRQCSNESHLPCAAHIAGRHGAGH
jgi:hypothetical protein